VGATPGLEVFREAAASVASDVTPSSDVHASAAYRRSLVEVLTRRALARAAERVPLLQ